MRALAILAFILSGSISAGLWGYELAEGWVRLEGCRYREGRHSDGDSVEAIHEGKDYVFRVYFVDCIEENPRSVERRRAQARYFGVKSEEEAVRHAQAAAHFTRQLLEERPFVVYTRWEFVTPGSDNPSIRAFVETADGQDLATELVKQGLAIIRGGQALADHPAGRSRSEILRELREWETQARLARRGAWAGNPTARNSSLPSAPASLRQLFSGNGKIFSPGELASLKKAAGTEARVRGRLAEVSSLPDKRITFLNFVGVPRGGFVAIVRGGQLAAFQSALGGELPAILTGREVEVRGVISLYKDIPQIELFDPSQLKVFGR